MGEKERKSLKARNLTDCIDCFFLNDSDDVILRIYLYSVSFSESGLLVEILRI